MIMRRLFDRFNILFEQAHISMDFYHDAQFLTEVSSLPMSIVLNFVPFEQWKNVYKMNTFIIFGLIFHENPFSPIKKRTFFTFFFLKEGLFLIHRERWHR